MDNELKESGVITLGRMVRNRTFLIPAIQRNYAWPADDAVLLTRQLVEAFKKNTQKSVGLITLWKQEDSSSEYQVIDGQQRLITLTLLFSLLVDSQESNPVQIVFRRDISSDGGTRRAVLYHKASDDARSVDTGRMIGNRREMNKVLEEFPELSVEQKKRDFAAFLLEQVLLLCNVSANTPQKEFLNLNAHKTKFSYCDYVRSRIIALPDINPEQYNRNRELFPGILSEGLEKNKRVSYKNAVSWLYDDILEQLYAEEEDLKSVYDEIDSVYKAVGCGVTADPETSLESRLNVLFEHEMLEAEKNNYRFDLANDFNPVHGLLYLTYCRDILHQIRKELRDGELPSIRQIQQIARKKKQGFFAAIRGLVDKKTESCRQYDSERLLQKILQSISTLEGAVEAVTVKSDPMEVNKYLDTYYGAEINTVYQPQDYPLGGEYNKQNLDQTAEHDIRCEINCTAVYMIRRYMQEMAVENRKLKLMPICDLDTEEAGSFMEIGDTASFQTVKDFFQHDIVIPMIQRDYCMGSQMGQKSGNKGQDFLGYLLSCHENDTDADAGCLLVAKEMGTDDFCWHIFDGQQRTFTLYLIREQLYEDLKYPKAAIKKYTFLGRTTGINGTLTPYSKRSADNLKKQLEERLKNRSEEYKTGLLEFVENRVHFQLKIVETMSSAQQFFIDINGGVKLKSFEIYKSVLFDAMESCGGDELVSRGIRIIENDFMDWAYALVKEARKYIPDEDKGKQTETAVFRYIEIVLCLIYSYRHKKSVPGLCIDESRDEAGNEVVADAESYLKELTKQDYDCLLNMLEELCRNPLSEEDLQKYGFGSTTVEISSVCKEEEYEKRWCVINACLLNHCCSYRITSGEDVALMLEEDHLLRAVVEGACQWQSSVSYGFYWYCHRRTDKNISITFYCYRGYQSGLKEYDYYYNNHKWSVPYYYYYPNYHWPNQWDEKYIIDSYRVLKKKAKPLSGSYLIGSDEGKPVSGHLWSTDKKVEAVFPAEYKFERVKGRWYEYCIFHENEKKVGAGSPNCFWTTENAHETTFVVKCRENNGDISYYAPQLTHRTNAYTYDPKNIEMIPVVPFHS